MLRHPDDVCAWHLYIVRLNLDQLSIDRDQFTRELDARGVGCSVHFIPLHLQPYWRDRYGLTRSMFRRPAGNSTASFPCRSIRT